MMGETKTQKDLDILLGPLHNEFRCSEESGTATTKRLLSNAESEK
jgi:hypothetical protein